MGSVVVFCAHSDDQIIGPGGTLAKYASQGVKVYTVIFSYGEAVHPLLKKRVVKKMRAEESYEADKVIGGSGVVFLGLRDGLIGEDLNKKKTEVKRMVTRFLKKNPEKVFTHSLDDPHPDHRAVCKFVLECVDSLKKPAEVYGFQIWNPFKMSGKKYPLLVVDVTQTFSKKIEALNCFKSQWAALFLLRWSTYVKGLLNGLRNNCFFAEVFYKLR